eukprot:9719167-Alexandrium_andersonii.AAC.1
MPAPRPTGVPSLIATIPRAPAMLALGGVLVPGRGFPVGLPLLLRPAVGGAARPIAPTAGPGGLTGGKRVCVGERMAGVALGKPRLPRTVRLRTCITS